MEVQTVIIGFVGMLLLIAVGIPVALSMAIIGIAGGVYVYGLPFMDSVAPVVWGVQNDGLLTAIPLFILIGELLLRSGMADRMYLALSAWMGALPGGLLHTNIGASAMFAATSGSSVATAATVGTVALPSLHERGYPMGRSLGSLAAGGTLGILIPPSVNMIVYGSITNNSIGQLFIAGLIPGLLLTGLFMLYIFLVSVLSKHKNPKEAAVSWREKLYLTRHLIPPLLIFGVIMGSLYSGIATATESASLGLMIALACVAYAGKLNKTLLMACFTSTARTAGMILFVMIAAFILNLMVSMTGVAGMMSNWVASLGFSLTETLLALIVFYLILGMFMDVLAMQVATIPVTYPIAMSLGADPIWFGIFIILMCELALITPPVGMNLFVVHGVRPDSGSVKDVMIGALPYAGLMIFFTILLIVFPAIVTWLPENMQ